MKPNPEWLTVSVTGLRAIAGFLDGEAAGAAGEEIAADQAERVLAQTAGQRLHQFGEVVKLWQISRPHRDFDTGVRDDYHTRLNNLQNLLPTTPPKEVRHIHWILDDPRLALPVKDHSAAESACFEILSEAVLADAVANPPLTDSYPLPLANDSYRPFLSPEDLNLRWQNQVVPELKPKMRTMLNWQLKHVKPMDGISNLSAGLLVGAPETRLAIILPTARATLIERADELTRLECKNQIRIEKIDFKSSSHIRVPETGSRAEEAERIILYFSTMAIACKEAQRHQKPGYPLICFEDVAPGKPRTLRPTDRVAVKFVALGGKNPEEVDLAEKYGDVLTNPVAAGETIANARGLLDIIRNRPELKKPR